MSFKNMKIKTPTVQDVRRVQEALYDLGYFWGSLVPDSNQYKFLDDCYALQTYDDGHIVRFTLNKTAEDDFNSCTDSEEHFLTLGGEFVTADYFTQPVTEADIEEPPAPFLTRQMYEAPRMRYLAECFLKAINAGNKVPVEWIEEFAEHNSRLQDNYDVY